MPVRGPESESNDERNEGKPEEKGDPSRLEIFRPGLSIGPNGFEQGSSSVFAALGQEKDILESLRQMGLSEEAIAAFKSGKPIVTKTQNTPFGRMIIDETWSGKKTSSTSSNEENTD